MRADSELVRRYYVNRVVIVNQVATNVSGKVPNQFLNGSKKHRFFLTHYSLLTYYSVGEKITQLFFLKIFTRLEKSEKIQEHNRT